MLSCLDQKRQTVGKRCIFLGAWLLTLLMLATALMAISAPRAFAYYDRGQVGVELGSQLLEVQAGQTASVTVAFTPASDNQTEGCGMPRCPQMCASTCMDENGQCRCAGRDYKTYYPSALAISSDSSVAAAVYSGNAVTVYGKKAGEATISVRGSLRQFRDKTVTFKVMVTGSADGGAVVDEAKVLPAAADVNAQDKALFVEKTIMGRAVDAVRIVDELDTATYLEKMASVDGDVTFWEGDTYYAPTYSLTFNGTTYAAGAATQIDPRLTVSTEPTGVLYQPLQGARDFVVVDFAQKGDLFAPTTVYVRSSQFAEGTPLGVFTYDQTKKVFVRDGAVAQVSGGYVTFDVAKGKTYVVSSLDLAAGGSTAVSASAIADVDGCSAVPQAPTSQDQGFPVAALVMIGTAVLVVFCLVMYAMRRGRGKKTAGVAGVVDGSKDKA